MQKINFNGMEIEYSEAILEKVREAYGIKDVSEVSEANIASFIKDSLDNAVNKGYGIVEEGSL